MSTNLLSKDWYRVADLAPRIRPQVDISLHHYHGQPSYVLYDRTSGQSFRTRASTYDILKQFDGVQTVDEIWQKMALENNPELPPQDELIEFMGRMYEANLISLPARARPTRLFELQRKHKGQWWRQLIKSPISQRIPLIDPRPILNRTEWIAQALFSPAGFIAFVGMLIFAVMIAVREWSALTENIADRMLAPDNLIIIGLVYPVVKLLHEMGHAWCIRRYGGDVPEMGVMFLLFIPIPYVDATHSNIFPQHWRRALVALAGLLTELGIGAACLIIWSQMDPGLGRAVLYNAVVICMVSSIFFNGNPLLRFDAYYVLADLTQTPNLGNRGNALWGAGFRKFLGIPEKAETETAGSGQRTYMKTYALAAFVYRLFITFTIVMLLLKSYPFVGQLLAVWAVYGSFIHPIGKGLFSLKSEIQSNTRAKALTRGGVLFTVVLGALLFLPLPKATVVEGLVTHKENASVVTNSEGVVSAICVKDGERVATTDRLLEITPQRLIAEEQVLVAQKKTTEAKIRAQLAGRESGLAEVLREELETTEASISRIAKQVTNSIVTSPSNGIWIWNGAVPKPGDMVFRGQVLGYIDKPENRRILGTVDAYYLPDIRSGVLETTWIAENAPFTSNQADQIEWMKQATTILPDIRLADQHGGEVLSEPGENPGDLFAVTPQIVVEAYANLEGVESGQKVILRIAHPWEPIAPRFWRWLRRTFLGLVGS